MRSFFAFLLSLRQPHPWSRPAALLLTAICLANLALPFPARGQAEQAAHLDKTQVKAERQRIGKEFRPLFQAMLDSDDPQVRIAALYAGASVIRDKALADMLRQRKDQAEFPEIVFINAFIAGATDADADVAAFLRSLPDTYGGCWTLYNAEAALTEDLPLRLVDQAYDYVLENRFPGLAESKTIWGEKFVLLAFLSSEATGYAKSDPGLQAWLAAHPDFDAEFQAQAEQVVRELIQTSQTGIPVWAQNENRSEKLAPLLKAIGAFFDHPDPMVRLTAFRMAARLADPHEDMLRRLELATDSREKLLLYSRLSLYPFMHNGLDFTLPLVREYPQNKEDYTRLLEWEYTVYSPGLLTLAIIANAAGITDDTLAEARPVLRRVLPWAAPYLYEDEARRYRQIAAGEFVDGEFYYWTGQVTEILSGDTFLVTVNSLGDTAKFRLNNADCPYPGQPYYEEALARAKELILGQTVTLRSGEADTLGRRTGWLEYGPMAESLARTLISDGLAQMPLPDSGQYANYYAAEEKTAQDTLNGIWSLPDPESPAAYRQRIIAETGQDPETCK